MSTQVKNAEPAQRTSARRPARPQRPGRPGRPEPSVRPGSPSRPAGPGHPGPSRATGPSRPGQEHLSDELALGRLAGPRPADEAGLRPAHQPGRVSFILLVLGMLAGGLICLLVVNTTLAAESLRISDLRQQNAAAQQQVQELRQSVARENSAAVIAREAARLGMRTQPLLYFLDPRTHRIRSESATAPPGVPAVPGYTP